jgi:hypothetical protein
VADEVTEINTSLHVFIKCTKKNNAKIPRFQDDLFPLSKTYLSEIQIHKLPLPLQKQNVCVISPLCIRCKIYFMTSASHEKLQRTSATTKILIGSMKAEYFSHKTSHTCYVAKNVSDLPIDINLLFHIKGTKVI